MVLLDFVLQHVIKIIDMKLIKLFLPFLFLAITFISYAQQDSLSMLNKRVVSLEHQMQSLKTQYDSLASANANLLSANLKQDEAIQKNASNVKVIADSLGVKIKTTETAVSSNEQSIKSKSILGAILIAALLVMVVVVFVVLRKRILHGTNEITELKEKADKLNEQVVTKLNTELSELQKIATAASAHSSNVSSEDMTDLIKTLADRITFMEMTLFRMDKTIKGYKQLSKSIDQMKSNLLANGYEIVDMLGKPYHEGMKAVVNYIEDENLESGQQIITGITKPQINHNGEMIQSAQITVSQN